MTHKERNLENISDQIREKLEIYHALLLKWQKAINLVSPATLDKAWERHFEDSEQLATHIPQEVKTLIDLGSGAGFPGLVLAIMNPDLNVHLIESDTRKCEFLKNVSRETNAAVTIHNERIEDILPDLSPDMITARALKSLKEILDFTWPSAQENPALMLLLLKGQKAQKEIEDALEKYDFDCEAIPSQTDPDASVLKVTNIHKA